MRIQNQFYKNKSITTAKGIITFDAEGIADVQPDEYAEKLTSLRGYKRVDSEEEQEEQPDNLTEEEVKEVIPESNSIKEENQQPQPAGQSEMRDSENETSLEDELQKLNVPQLKKYAKDNEIDLAGAAKKDEIISIILGNK